MLTALLLASFVAGEPYTAKEVSIIDGDTLNIDGVKVRIANIDAPERGARAACDAERFLAVQATRYAEELARRRPLVVWSEGRKDKYQRPLVRVTVNGIDWGAAMIEASLAVSWGGKRHAWCAAHEAP